MNNISELEFYDRFSCIADKCSFTCCRGWDISVDSDTFEKWKNDKEHSEYICRYVKSKKAGNKTGSNKTGSNKMEYSLKMGAQKCCPFLSEKGLCGIVINCGEDYLSKTCSIFPRQENDFDDLKEYSLSCACPEVVDIIKSMDQKIKIISDHDESVFDNLPKIYWIRENMISIMQKDGISLKDRIMLVFNMLLMTKNGSETTYTEQEHWDSCREINELFLDIVENYKKEKTFSGYLRGIAETAEDFDDQFYEGWNDFRLEFVQYEKLLENCIVSKIFANCIEDDIDEIIMSFQVIVTEFVMVKYSLFLKWLMNGREITKYSDLRDYIVIYSRIIGYNSEGIKEFWEDSFDEAIWDFEYMYFILS